MLRECKIFEGFANVKSGSGRKKDNLTIFRLVEDKTPDLNFYSSAYHCNHILGFSQLLQFLKHFIQPVFGNTTP